MTIARSTCSLRSSMISLLESSFGAFRRRYAVDRPDAGSRRACFGTPRSECQSSRMPLRTRSPRRGRGRRSPPACGLAVAEPESVNLGLVVGTGRVPARRLRFLTGARSVDPERDLLGHGGCRWRRWSSRTGTTTTRSDWPPSATSRRSGTSPCRRGWPSAEAAEVAADRAGAVVAGRRRRRLIAVAAAVDLGGRRVEIAHLGRGHTDGDLVIVVPGRERGLRRRPDRVLRPAVVRSGQPSGRVGEHPGRPGRADDGPTPRPFRDTVSRWIASSSSRRGAKRRWQAQPEPVRRLPLA